MRLAVLISFLVYFSINTYSQEYRFSQFYQYPVILNPALTGLAKNLRVTSGYKIFPDTGSAAKQVYLSNVEMTFFNEKRKKIFIGGGGGAMYDKNFIGQQQKYEVSLSSAFHLILNDKNSISSGVYTAVIRKKVTVANDKYAEFSYTDIASGIQWDYSKAEQYFSANNNLNFNLGFAMFHLNRPHTNFSVSKQRVKPAFQIHSMAYIGILATSISVIPAFSYFNNGYYSELMIGTNVKYYLSGQSQYAGNLKNKVFLIGGLFKYNSVLNDYFVTTIYFELGEVGLGISYDYNLLETNKIADNYNALEVSVIFIHHKGYSYNSKIRKWE